MGLFGKKKEIENDEINNQEHSLFGDGFDFFAMQEEGNFDELEEDIHDDFLGLDEDDLDSGCDCDDLDYDDDYDYDYDRD